MWMVAVTDITLIRVHGHSIVLTTAQMYPYDNLFANRCDSYSPKLCIRHSTHSLRRITAIILVVKYFQEKHKGDQSISRLW